jgi:hypothetical protein
LLAGFRPGLVTGRIARPVRSRRSSNFNSYRDIARLFGKTHTTAYPHPRDVIVHNLHTLSSYGVGFYGGLIIFIATSHDAARELAEMVARKQRIDVWYTEDELSYSRMARFRSAVAP